jgi:vitamin B12 transporter
MDSVVFRSEHTFLHAKDAQTNLQLLRTPMHKFTQSLIIKTFESWVLGASVTSFGKRADISGADFKRISVKGPTLTRVFATLTVNDHVEIFGRIENAFNTKAEMPDGYAIPGVAAYVGIKIKS